LSYLQQEKISDQQFADFHLGATTAKLRPWKMEIYTNFSAIDNGSQSEISFHDHPML
jgi:hypothetical protein